MLVGKKKRRIPASPDTSPDRSSPLKRKRGGSRLDPELDSDVGDNADYGQEPLQILEDARSHTISARFPLVKPIARPALGGQVGRILCRELDISCTFRCRRVISQCNTSKSGYFVLCALPLLTIPDWQSETTDFFSQPEDSYQCTSVDSTSAEQTVPFCTASCNSELVPMVEMIVRSRANPLGLANSLVAIGDEDGGIRLLESAKDGKPGFSQPYLSFHPHANAILDLAFTADDMLLATASGDQTAQIIDMTTQRAITTLAGHVASVKQVRFQPGSSSVIATSSRDGSVHIWDLRCKGFKTPTRDMRVSLHPSDGTTASKNLRGEGMTWARSVKSFYEAHAIRRTDIANTAFSSSDAPSKTEAPGRKGDMSITALSFFPAGREHLFLTGSEANASVKLWDLRTTHSRRQATPLSTTTQPESHNRHRQFGLTSLALGGDGSRLYTLCRDNTVYVYSTSHLILGHAPELSLRPSRPKGSGGAEKIGLGPLYGFRHPQFHATTFYVKLALRAAAGNRSELLAVGSYGACAVLFPTDEQYTNRQSSSSDALSRRDHPETPVPTSRNRPPLSRNGSSVGLSARSGDTIPIYGHGSALVRGHSEEVTGLTWTSEGELVTVGDDFVVRCWREGPKARDLRMGGEKDGRRWGCGWAEVDGDWDSDE